jgi:SAM-dependent methyltransferase
MVYATAAENATYLRDLYFRDLLALHPKTVLDVGCGQGEILRRCHEHGIAAMGLENPTRNVEDLPPDRSRIVLGEAQNLPFAESSFDWVCMRHVPHHLAEPEAAFAEAMRVCRIGFYLAEPWFDPTLPCQRSTELADLWLKKQHQRTGMVHRPNFDLAGLMQLLPAQYRAKIEVHISQRHSQRRVDEFLHKCAEWLDRLPPEHADRAAFAELRSTIERTGLGWNGSIVLTVRK